MIYSRIFILWFDITSYYLAQITIGPIISSFKIPSYLLSYFNEIKETYAFGKYRASVALCRALLEMALYRKLKAKGAFRDKKILRSLALTWRKKTT